ncbi:hypothetical protein D623_10011784 [Myotis brandtii]|uniref:Uncharacterized protein n=1 Tax=Myotis brandtii TaxID=109478 RepID=S7PIQ5_MYOBR|nr:hypothetical protein D623_10011784 [Myotis brandtii]
MESWGWRQGPGWLGRLCTRHLPGPPSPTLGVQPATRARAKPPRLPAERPAQRHHGDFHIAPRKSRATVCCNLSTPPHSSKPHPGGPACNPGMCQAPQASRGTPSSASPWRFSHSIYCNLSTPPHSCRSATSPVATNPRATGAGTDLASVASRCGGLAPAGPPRASILGAGAPGPLSAMPS